MTEGDVIVAVDGRKVGADGNLGELLEGSAGRVVELTVHRGENERQVAVVPMADELRCATTTGWLRVAAMSRSIRAGDSATYMYRIWSPTVGPSCTAKSVRPLATRCYR